MLNPQLGAELVELVAPGRCPCPGNEESVCELFSIIGQYLGDPDRAGPVQIAQDRRALAAVLAGRMRTNTHRVARSMATNRYRRVVSSAICGKYFKSTCRKPGS